MNKKVRVWANTGTIIAAFWLMTFLVPEAREMMLDTLFSFLLGLFVTALLWWKSAQEGPLALFWRLLASGWTIALVANVAWGVYELATGRTLPYISLLDVLYLARYALLFVAFIRVLGIPGGRQWLNLITVLAAAFALALGLYFASAPAAHQSSTLYMAGAVYPILDMGLVYLALEGWMQSPDDLRRPVLGVLALALMSYGTANWLNAYGHLIEWTAISGLATLFWPISDILTAVAALDLLRPPEEE